MRKRDRAAWLDLFNAAAGIRYWAEIAVYSEIQAENDYPAKGLVICYILYLTPIGNEKSSLKSHYFRFRSDLGSMPILVQLGLGVVSDTKLRQ